MDATVTTMTAPSRVPLTALLGAVGQLGDEEWLFAVRERIAAVPAWSGQVSLFDQLVRRLKADRRTTRMAEPDQALDAADRLAATAAPLGPEDIRKLARLFGPPRPLPVDNALAGRAGSVK